MFHPMFWCGSWSDFFSQMKTRHANMIAMAHFLKTRAEPVLVSDIFLIVLRWLEAHPCEKFYKPWQSRPGDESVIEKQIEEAKATVAREVAEFEARYPPEAFAPQPDNSIKEEPVAKEGETQGEKKMQQTDTPSDQPSAPEPMNSKEPDSKESAQETAEMAKVENNEKEAGSAAMDTSADVDTAGHGQNDAHRDDDGGEVVEDNEDTVIY
jgi:hypothetical protein